MRTNRTNKTQHQALKERILDTAMTAFVTNGIKAVKMDDIAKMLGISKRTLYETYENKEVLLYEGVKMYQARKEEMFKTIYNETPDLIDILLGIYRLKVEESKKVCPEFFSDLEKYPSVQEFFKEIREQGHHNFVEFLKRGVQEGYFRDDMQLDLISHIFTSMVEHITRNHLYKTYSIEEIFHNVVFVSLRGFSTQKGIERLDRY